jgi:hypothetical protein
MYKSENFLGVSYEDLEQEVQSLFLEIESRRKEHLKSTSKRSLTKSFGGSSKGIRELNNLAQ